jgi:hypothetical protein
MKATIEIPFGTRLDSLKGYCALAQLEVWLRELVYLALKTRFGSDWWNQANEALRRARTRGIPAERSMRGDRKHPHMSTPENDPLWFVSFDSLLTLLFDRKLWRLFEPYLTTKELLRAKFDEIKPIRNRIAHFRALHTDDLERTTRILKDLDQRLWKLCADYGDEFPFYRREKDPIYKHFAQNGLLPTTASPFGGTERHGTTVNLTYSRLASAKSIKATRIIGTPGLLYNFNFSTDRTHRMFDFQGILERTKFFHDTAVHIVLEDPFSGRLRVTFPAVTTPANIIAAADAFHSACSNCFTPRFDEPAQLSGKRLSQRVQQRATRIQTIASEWPHYVLSSSHPFSILDSGTPCNIFTL